MTQARYSGEFLAENIPNLQAALSASTLIGSTGVMLDDAAEILENRPNAERHRIACRVEAVIQQQALKIATIPPTDPIGRVLWKSRIKKEPDAEQVRFYRGDVALWLSAGAERAPVPADEPKGFPKGVRRAEYFAVIALWKSVSLHAVTKSMLREVRNFAGGLAMTEIDADDPTAALFKSPIIRTFGGMNTAAQLSSEITRAATLATEADFLEDQLERMRTTASAETKRALKEVANHRLKEAGAKGGNTRAAAYAPIKARAIALYKGGVWPSISKAATDIHLTLTNEGMNVAHSYVYKHLAAHERSIVATRQRKLTR